MKNVREMEPVEVLNLVRSQSGLLAFATLIRLRIEAGRSIYALRMLCAVGAPKREAYRMIERWPLHDRRLLEDVMTADEEGACFLAFNVSNALDFNWPMALGRAARHADQLARRDEVRAEGEHGTPPG